jgi:hypothetical protein
MLGDNGFQFDNNQGVAPCRPKPTEQNPKHPLILSGVRKFRFSMAQLLAHHEVLDGLAATGTEEDAEEREQADEYSPLEFAALRSYGDKQPVRGPGRNSVRF